MYVANKLIVFRYEWYRYSMILCHEILICSRQGKRNIKTKEEYRFNLNI